MKNTLIIISIVVLGGCSAKVNDGSGVPPGEQDTVFTSRSLLGGGSVEIASSGGWQRHTLIGCVTETDGVALEMRPVVVYLQSADGGVDKEFQVAFSCRVQPGYTRGEAGERVPDGSGALPVVTGTRFISIVADRTEIPFLVEESESHERNVLDDGTLACAAVYSIPDWMMRTICSAGTLTAVSSDPEFRIQFGDHSRRLLQQFHDIFVVHDGEPPVMPVTP